MFETFCNQSTNDTTQNAYLKIISVFSQILALIITSSFGAVIASFVAVENLEVPFTNIEEFVQNGEYKLALYRDTFLDQRYFYEVMKKQFFVKLENNLA